MRVGRGKGADGGGGGGNDAAARKALQDAFGGKKDVLSEFDGGGGGKGGGGWWKGGSGGGGGRYGDDVNKKGNMQTLGTLAVVIGILAAFALFKPVTAGTTQNLKIASVSRVRVPVTPAFTFYTLVFEFHSIM
jgi:hypothetical protein